MNKFVYYLPRVLSLIMVGFCAMFILEGIGPEFGWQDSIAHLALTVVVLGITIVAWKWPKIGGWIFILLSIPPLSAIRSGEWMGVLIGVVPFVAGILFLIEGFGQKRK